MAKQNNLPPTLSPRLIPRSTAAAYISVSPMVFDEMVADGRMPRPRRISLGRLAWDIRELDLAVDQLPVEGVNVSEDSSWEDVDAKAGAYVR